VDVAWVVIDVRHCHIPDVWLSICSNFNHSSNLGAIIYVSGDGTWLLYLFISLSLINNLIIDNNRPRLGKRENYAMKSTELTKNISVTLW